MCRVFSVLYLLSPAILLEWREDRTVCTDQILVVFKKKKSQTPWDHFKCVMSCFWLVHLIGDKSNNKKRKGPEPTFDPPLFVFMVHCHGHGLCNSFRLSSTHSSLLQEIFITASNPPLEIVPDKWATLLWAAFHCCPVKNHLTNNRINDSMVSFLPRGLEY